MCDIIEIFHTCIHLHTHLYFPTHYKLAGGGLYSAGLLYVV